MTTREWEALESIKKTVDSLNIRFGIVEEQVKNWQSRDRWLQRTIIAAVIAFGAWLIQHQF